MRGTQINMANASVLLLATGISILFFFMVKGFLMAIVLSAIFSGVMFSFYERLAKYFKGRNSLASILTVLFFILVVLIPLSTFTIVMVDQAVSAGKSFLPVVEESLSDPNSFIDELETIGIVHQIFPERKKLITTVDNAVKSLGNFVATGLSHVTSGAVTFFFPHFYFPVCHVLFSDLW